MTYELHKGDNLAVMRSLPAASFDALITDPPAGIGMMQKEWDDFRRRRNPADVGRDNVFGRTSAKGPEYARRARDAFVRWLAERLTEARRLVKPGGLALVWSIPRTSHWTGYAVEDAGWEIEDQISHFHGQGFPKHRSKLKPAREDWWLARNPGPKWLGVEACRIGWQGDPPQIGTPGWGGPNKKLSAVPDGNGRSAERAPPSPVGRWPANLVLSHHADCRRVGTRRVKGSSGVVGSEAGGAMAASNINKYHRTGRKDIGKKIGYTDADGMEAVEAWECHPDCPVRLLNTQAGPLRSGKAGPDGHVNKSAAGQNVYKGMKSRMVAGSVLYGDSGGASRFFYCSKAPRAQRWIFCTVCNDAFPAAGRDEHAHGKARGQRYHVHQHPTVKSLDLMSYLCRLVTPPGGRILDPFCGSGSTVLAAVRAGYSAVGIDDDSEPGSIAVAARRLEQWEFDREF